MVQRSNKWSVDVLKPPLEVIAFVAKAMYKLIFGRADRRLALRHQRQLAQDICDEMPFLFNEYGGKIIPNQGVPFPPGFDYAVVTMAISELRFRFVRGRGDLDVYVSSTHEPEVWRNVLLVISSVEGPDDLRYSAFISLRDAADVLRKKMPLVQEAFSSSRYPLTKLILDNHREYEKAVLKQLQNDINHRLYS